MEHGLSSALSQTNVVNPLSRSCVDKAKEIHASIYSTNQSHKAAILGAYYAPRATFNDPLVSVAGIHAITQQYMFLTLLPKVRITTRTVTWAHLGDATTAAHSVAAAAATTSASRLEVVVVDAVVVFTLLPLLPAGLADVAMRIVTTLRFDATGRVISHEDLWSFRELLGGLGGGNFFGKLLDTVRFANGYVSTFAIEHILWLRDSFGSSFLRKPKRTFSGGGLNSQVLKGSSDTSKSPI
ncbi:hypothetical protein HK100_007798 [Physocladia obscura]|uniref:Uncharacterized protein n=1 Tax=Physocladia obscura TaxID=109957 RepID=A0AAD5T543_9FUNG|nr:hypothetical protein HK100_007798 [Physocladia obscura]